MSLYDRGNYANEAVGQLIPFFKEKLVKKKYCCTFLYIAV
ncbi:hypothetical protein J2810_000283 [Chryseobacterium rhizosphaerae]|nr:hypothetical protein [Chryseobacterium rhizosphaerae]